MESDLSIGEETGKGGRVHLEISRPASLTQPIKGSYCVVRCPLLLSTAIIIGFNANAVYFCAKTFS
jgi:hypothetical protein